MVTAQERFSNRLVLISAAEATAATVAFILAAMTLAWQLGHHFTTLYQDEIFDQLRFFRADSGFASLLKYLTRAHNEHRIMTSRLVFMADDYFFRGRLWAQVIVTTTLQMISCYISYRVAARLPGGTHYRPAERALLFTTCLILFINPNLFYTLLVPFQVAHAIMAFLVILAALLIACASEWRQTGANSAAILSGLILLAIVATLTLGNAPVILLAALAAAVILQWPLRVAVAIGALAALHTALILITTKSVGSPAFHPLAMVKFSLLYLGAPFLRFEAWPAPYATWQSSPYLAATFGAVMPATAIAFAVLRRARPGLGGRLGVFGFMILVVVIITAIAAAHSRAQFGILEGASRKYASFSALGWLGAIAVAFSVVRDLVHLPYRPEMLVLGAALVVLLPLTMRGYSRETRIWHSMIDSNRESALAEFMHINNRGRLEFLYPDEKGVAEFIDDIERSRLGVFSEFPFRLGDDAAAFLAARTQGTCRGEVQTLSPLPPSDSYNIFANAPGTQFSVSGWAWMDGDEAPPQTVIVADRNGHIAGVASTTQTGSRAEDWLGQKLPGDVGWFGFARLTDATGAKFYALSNDLKTYCALGTVGNWR